MSILTTLSTALLRVAIAPLLVAFVLVASGTMDTVINNVSATFTAFEQVRGLTLLK